jgi:hypothetical protein
MILFLQVLGILVSIVVGFLTIYELLKSHKYRAFIFGAVTVIIITLALFPTVFSSRLASSSPDLNFHAYRLIAQGNTITLYVDGGKYISVADNTYISGGQIGIYAANDEVQVKSFKVIAL